MAGHIMACADPESLDRNMRREARAHEWKCVCVGA